MVLSQYSIVSSILVLWYTIIYIRLIRPLFTMFLLWRVYYDILFEKLHQTTSSMWVFFLNPFHRERWRVWPHLCVKFFVKHCSLYVHQLPKKAGQSSGAWFFMDREFFEKLLHEIHDFGEFFEDAGRPALYKACFWGQINRHNITYIHV